MRNRIACSLLIASSIVMSAIACGTSADPGNLAPTPPAPIGLTSATPAIVSARGGDVVSLAGSGFAKDTAVKIGNTNAAKIELISASELHVTTPPLWAGPADVAVSGPGGNAQLSAALQVQALDLRFVQAPTYSLAIGNDLDAGADAAAAGVDARPSPPVAVAVTDDFDGDGDIDLVTCASGEACHFLQNDGQGNFDDRAQSGDDRFGAGSIDAQQYAIGDFDGDGDRDLVLAGPTGPMTIETNDGHAHFTESQLSWIQFGDGGISQIEVDGGAAPLDPVTALAAGDIDGDGKIDLVVGNATPDQTPFRILMNAGGGEIRFTESASGSVPARDWAVRGIGVADVDGNGTADIVVSTPGASDGIEMRLLLGEKSTFSEAHGGLPNVVGADVTAFSIADLNGDKAVDIVAAGKGQDRLLVNDGTGHFFDSSGTSMPLDDTTATSIMLVDLDRDRDLDLIVGNQTAATRLYLNDGAGVFRDYTPLLPLASSNATWVAAADADGDSDQDIFIVSAAPTTPRLYLSVEKLP